MKKLLIFTLAILLIALSSVFFVSAENSPSDVVSSVGAVTGPPADLEGAGQDYADDTTFLDGARAFISAYWDKFVVAFYVVYNIFPKIGAIAKSKKDRSNLKATLNSYFGEDGSVLNLQNALAATQTKFMNDTSAVLGKVEASAAAIEKIAKQYADAMTQRTEMKNLALACQGAVTLMASQLNDLVMNSPSITAKKKAEIDAAWCERNAMLAALVERMAANDEQGENSVA